MLNDAHPVLCLILYTRKKVSQGSHGLGMWGKSDLHIAVVEYREIDLEEDVPIDLRCFSVVGLNTTDAH